MEAQPDYLFKNANVDARRMYVGQTMARTAIQNEAEQANQRLEIIDLGVLSEKKWLGSISAEKMIESGQFSEELLNEAVNRFPEFYGAVDLAARTRCIDGRFDPMLNSFNLGPQVPAGAPGAAMAYRLGVDRFDINQGTFLIDVDSMVDEFVRNDLNPGAHRDEYSIDKEGVIGCAAIDRIDAVLAAMIDGDLVNDHMRVVELLMGKDFSLDNYMHVMGAAVVLNGRSEDYFRDRDTIVTIIENHSEKNVATLEGVHQECIVGVNHSPLSTFDTNRFVKTFDGLQAFNYDVWFSKKVAEMILPRPNQALDRQRFIMGRVMMSVATLMVITDGSQRLIMRLPSEDKTDIKA